MPVSDQPKAAGRDILLRASIGTPVEIRRPIAGPSRDADAADCNSPGSTCGMTGAGAERGSPSSGFNTTPVSGDHNHGSSAPNAKGVARRRNAIAPSCDTTPVMRKNRLPCLGGGVITDARHTGPMASHRKTMPAAGDTGPLGPRGKPGRVREAYLPTDSANDPATFIDEVSRLLGPDRVLGPRDATNAFGRNETSSPRSVLAVLRPANTMEVCEIVKTASRHGVPLYPVSRGRNWGYGGGTPVVDGCAVIDLSSMNRVVALDEELGLATLQPGVTPRGLCDYLNEKGLAYLVPVCGAGPDHSLLGNALERGYGVTPYADHFGAVMSLEAVLPNGEIYRSALSSLGGEAVDRAFKWGLGPYLDGIFTQSNLGIVTEMTIALAPRPECVTGFLISLESDALLGEAVTAIRDTLSSDGGVIGSINLMNDRRVLSMTSDYPRDEILPCGTMPEETVTDLCNRAGIGAWTVGGVIYGDRGATRLAKRRIKSQFKRRARRVAFFDSRKIENTARLLRFLPGRRAATLRKQLDSLREAFKVAHGAPTEIALRLCYWKSGRRPPEGESLNPSRDGCGAIWYSPLVPMKSAEVLKYVGIVEEHCTAHGIEPLITLTSLSPRCFDSTVPLLFDPSDSEETARAKECYRALFRAGCDEGFVPYRVGIDHMDLVTARSSPFWDLVGAIKGALDPAGILAPGRYCRRGR